MNIEEQIKAKQESDIQKAPIEYTRLLKTMDPENPTEKEFNAIIKIFDKLHKSHSEIGSDREIVMTVARNIETAATKNDAQKERDESYQNLLKVSKECQDAHKEIDITHGIARKRNNAAEGKLSAASDAVNYLRSVDPLILEALGYKNQHP